MTGDDAEARRLRAEALRRQVEALSEGKRPTPPPRSPHEFVEREMRERAEKEQEESGDEAQDDAESSEGDQPSE